MLVDKGKEVFDQRGAKTAVTLFVLAAIICALMLAFVPINEHSTRTASAADAGSSLANSSATTVKVGYYYNAGYMHKDESGDFEGFDVEYLYTLAGYANWNIQFVEYSSLSDALAALNRGDIDLMTSLAKTTEREQDYMFSNQIMSQSHIAVMTRSTDERFVPGDASTLVNAQAAVLKNTLPETLYIAWCQENGLTPHIIECDTLEQRDALLESGQADAIVAGTMIEGTQKIAEFPGVDLYFMLNKGGASLKTQLDKAASTLLLSDPTFTETLRDKYFPNSMNTTPTFTSKEKAFIAAHPKIKVAVLADDAPYSYRNSDGSLTGILPDYYAHLSDLTGMDFACVAYDGSAAAFSALQSGEADMVGMVRRDVYDANSRGLVLTASYIDMNMVQVTRVGSGEVSSIAADERDFSIVQDALEDSPAVDVREYVNGAACFNALKSGAVDAVVCSQQTASWFLNHNRLSDYGVTYFSTDNWSVSGALRAGDEGNTLRVILDKTLAVDSGYIDQVITKNTLETDDSLSGFLDRIPVSWAISLAIFFFFIMAVVLVALIVIVRHRKRETELARQKIEVDKRDAELAANERANEAQRSFFASVSHDMRTPLNGIMGFADMALEAEDPQVQKEYLSKIKTSGQILAELVNDTLVMSRVESGKLRILPTPNDNMEFFEGVCAPIRVMAHEKGIEFVEDLTGVSRRTIMVDRLNTQKVLLNLLSNAVKFTPAGGKVTMRISFDASSAADPDTVISVSDTGIGMSADFLPRAFEPFAQEDPAHAGAAGTGLGLSIVKSLVDAMGGTIAVESERGKGTTFTVRLHFEPTDKVPAKISARADGAELTRRAAALQGKRVLVCEDNAMNLEIIKGILDKYGIVAHGCVNGKEGVEAFERSVEGEYFAVLLDLRMPVMGGESAARAIRALDRADAKRVPIFAVSADAYPENIESCLAAGMNGHIAKPVDAEELLRALAPVDTA